MENVGDRDGNGKADCNGGDAAERDDAGADPEDDFSKPCQSVYLNTKLFRHTH